MNKFKQASILVFFIILFQITFGQKETSKPVIKELEAAETKMFESITKIDRGEYLKNYVSDDYFSINADGSTQNKTQVAADSAGGKFFEAFTYKYFDKKIKAYDNVGIINGRCQAF